jgi:hypothetical protein
MPLPDFMSRGDMPPGVYVATLDETLVRFGSGSARRRLLASRLKRVYEVALATGNRHRFVVCGSFVTNKRAPNDVDVFMIMDDNFDIGSQVG